MFFIGLVIFGILLFLLTKPKNNTSSSPINIDKDTLGNMVGVYLRTRSVEELQEAIRIHSILLDSVGTVQQILVKSKMELDIVTGANKLAFWESPLALIAHRSQVIAEDTKCEKALVYSIGQEIYFLYLLRSTLYIINHPQFQPMVNTPQSYALEKRTSKYMK